MTTFAKIPRRILTGIQNGKSTIVEDSLATNVSEHYPGLIISDIWSTTSIPVDLSEVTEPENTALPIVPQTGSYFRYVHIPPDRELGIEAPLGLPHPLMHQTDTLDYIMILSGEIWLVLEETETLLKPGDIVIQRGTNHAWSNRSDAGCIQLAILLGASK